MDKIQQTKKFEEIMSSLGFLKEEENEHSSKYKNKMVLLQLFFGRYSERPDIFVRFEDESIPEQFTVSSMMFIDEISRGLNPLNGIDDNDRLNLLINYFAQNSGLLLKKSVCRERKKNVERYLAENF